MCDKKKKTDELRHGEDFDIAELNSIRRANFSVESNSGDPVDIAYMTGKNNTNDKKDE